MLCLWHDVVANEIDQKLHALRPAAILVDHLLKLLFTAARYNPPLFKNPVPIAALKVALSQRGQVTIELHLLVLLDHQAQIEGFDVELDLLGDIVCSFLYLGVEPLGASQRPERFHQEDLLVLVDGLDQAVQKLLFKLFLALPKLAVLVPGPIDAENGRVLDFELECKGLLGVDHAFGGPDVPSTLIRGRGWRE